MSDSSNGDTERVGWFVPDDEETANRILSVLEANGYEWEERYGGQLLSDVSYEITRSFDADTDRPDPDA